MQAQGKTWRLTEQELDWEKGGIRPLHQGNSTLWAEAKGLRIVTHACSIPALSSETIGLATLIRSSLLMITAHYWCITTALKAAIYWLPSISHVGIVSWGVHFTEMCHDVNGGDGLGWKEQAVPYPRGWKMHTERWSEEGNNWRWLRPLCAGNEEILHSIPTAPAAALNETLGLNAFFSVIELACKSPSYPLTCRQLRGSTLRALSEILPWTPISGLHITTHNRLNTGQA